MLRRFLKVSAGILKVSAGILKVSVGMLKVGSGGFLGRKGGVKVRYRRPMDIRYLIYNLRNLILCQVISLSAL
jgi:hypothetical protein